MKLKKLKKLNKAFEKLKPKGWTVESDFADSDYISLEKDGFQILITSDDVSEFEIQIWQAPVEVNYDKTKRVC